MTDSSERQGTLSLEKRALLEIQRLRSRIKELESSRSEPLAIIGMACRFGGGATTPELYWRVLAEGRDAVIEVPPGRWDIDAYYDPDPDAPGKMSTRSGGFLSEDIAAFDPTFFGISAIEARQMDPQQRMLLEVAWEALESSGRAPESLFGREVGVFVGITANDYHVLQSRDDSLESINAYSNAGIGPSVAAGRLSYVFGFHGPSVALDTACSSSLVALHLACQSLRNNECRLALAGGVNLMLAPDVTVGFSKSHLMAPDGRCKTFSSSADGYGRGEGCGLVVLKRLSEAIADGDNIVGLVRGSAVNQDGRSSALTAPNGPAQEAVIRAALASGQITPDQVSYVECHGTGTPLGDPIEVDALGAVYGQARGGERPLAIGSVKTNLGHLESGAGAASLLKVLLALGHERIPPHLHLREINSAISIEDNRVVVPVLGASWLRGEQPRLAGVSGFAFQGTNAHVVVEEAPARDAAVRDLERPKHLLTLSARNEEGLAELVKRYRAHLSSKPQDDLGDLCFTANCGRNHFTHRLTVVAESVASLREKLAAYAEGESLAGVAAAVEKGRPRRVAFLFSGESSGYQGMGQELYSSEPRFREAMGQCERVAQAAWQLSIVDLLSGKAADRPGALAHGLAVFSVGYALAQLWKGWGLKPASVMGCGVGELAAACVAGVMSLEDAMKLAAARLAAGQSGAAVPGGMELKSPLVTLISAESGEELKEEARRLERWCDGRRDASGMGRGVEKLRQLGVDVFLEMGPGSAMIGRGRAALGDGYGVWGQSLQRGVGEWDQLLSSLSLLYLEGVRIDWEGFDAGYRRRRVVLPTYPFRRQRYWMEEISRARRDTSEPRDEGAFLGREVVSSELHVFESRWTTQSPPWIADHGVHGAVVVPGAGHIDLALDAAERILGPGPKQIEDVAFREPLVFGGEDEERRVQIIMTPGEPGRFSFQVVSQTRGQGEWTRHASGQIRNESLAPTAALSLDEARRRCEKAIDATEYYGALRRLGFDYQGSFQGIERLWRGKQEALGLVRVPEREADEARSYSLYPGLLDSCFQTGLALRDEIWGEGGEPQVPVGVKRLCFWRRPEGRVFCYFVRHKEESQGDEAATGDYLLFEEGGELIARVEGFQAKRASRGAMLRAVRQATPEWIYEDAWERQDAAPREADLAGRWLIFADRRGTGEALARRLEQAGGTCWLVWAGDEQEAIGERRSRISAQTGEGLDEIVREGDGEGWRGVVHLWSLDGAPAEQTTLESLRKEQTHGCATVLRLVQQLAKAKATPRVWLVTRGALSVHGEGATSIAPAALWGLGRTITLEHAELKCARVDLDPRGADDLQPIWQELGAAEEEEIGYRGDVRYVRRLARWRAAREPARAFRFQGVYLITGGLGGLGLRLSRWLAEKGVGGLVLLERRAASSEAQEQLRELQRLGLKVQVIEGDVTSPEVVARAVQAAETMGELKGVVHTAGLLDDAMLVEQDLQRFERVMWPKVLGAWNLHQSTAGKRLDAFVLYASQAGLMGSRGQGSYAAANVYLDALAQYRRSAGLPATSIDWGPWGEVGMSAAMGERGERQFATMGIGMIPPARGFELMEQMLAAGAVHVGVMVVDWKRLQQSLPEGKVRPLLLRLMPGSEGKRERAETEWVRTLARALPAERIELLRAQVRDIAARAIGLDPRQPIDTQQPLMDLGMDSLMAVELRNSLCRAIGRPVPATVAFDYPTIDAIAAYLERDVLHLGQLKEQPAEVQVVRRTEVEPIAVVGMACRFPGGGSSLEGYWELLRNGVDGIVEVPRDRWSLDTYYDPDPDQPGKMYTRWGGFLREGVDQFDSTMFGISPIEAEGMDPQQRFLLEVAWEALEDSGHSAERLKGEDVGVFIGITSTDYQLLQAQLPNMVEVNGYTNAGCAFSVAAGRLSYVFGFQGPSVAIDTACSSSLVSVHLACGSLLSGESRLALAGGVNLMMAPQATVGFSKSRLMAPDGHCKTFDASADGYVRGEGCGLLVLKRLSDALRDGDRIRALIRGSAVNQDGASSALTAPNGPAQQAVIRRALAASGVAPQEVKYVECHGTGTSLGDPIEVQSLGEVFGEGRSGSERMAIGSVKTNLGHLEAAAGMASMIKVILALEHEEVPPHLHLRAPNPFIALDQLPVVVSTERMGWPRGAGRRLAGVSGFAFQGTNAHVVLEEAPVAQAPASSASRPVHLLTLSARTEEALKELVSRYLLHLERSATPDLGDLCFTANAGRTHLVHRVAVMAETALAVRARLEGYARGEILAGVAAGVASPRPKKAALLFGGAESAYLGMGRELYQSEPRFKAVIDRCEAVVKQRGRSSIVERLLGGGEKWEERDRVAAVLAVECALAELWRAFGVRPAAVMGVGVGELAAAYTAGVMELEEALQLAVQEDGAAVLASMSLKRPEVAVVSAESGEDLGEAVCRAEHWRPWAARASRHVGKGMDRLRQMGVEVFIEAGPGGRTGAQGRAASPEAYGVWVRSLERGVGDFDQLLRSLGLLYVDGMRIDWAELDAPHPRRRVTLPTYPFQRKRYWPEAARAVLEQKGLSAAPSGDEGAFLGVQLVSAGIHVFESRWTGARPGWIPDHAVHGAVVVPGAAHVDLMLAAAEQVLGAGPKRIDEVVFQEPLIFGDDEKRRVQVILTPTAMGAVEVQTVSQGVGEVGEEEWTRHASGQVRSGDERVEDGPSLGAAQRRCREGVDPREYYAALARLGFGYRKSFQGIIELWRGEGASLGLVEVPEEEAEEASGHDLYPGLLDSCFQVGMVLRPEIWGGEAEPFIPVGIQRLQYRRRPSGRVWCHFVKKEGDAEGDCFIYSEGGELLARVEGFRGKRASRSAMLRGLRRGAQDWVYTEEWEKQDVPREGAGEVRGAWLVYADQGGLGEEVARRIEEQGGKCWLLQPGGALERLGERRYLIGAARGEGLDEVLRELGSEPWRGVVFLWGLESTSSQQTTLETLRREQTAACGSLLRLVQLAAAAEDQPSLWVVTRGAVSVGNADTTSIAQAALWGLGRTIALEHPELSCRRVDLDPRGSEDAAVLWSELSSPGEEEVGYRQGTRHVRRLARWRGPSGGQSFRFDGVYLVTGGLGGLGLLLARRMVQRGVKGLVLLERKAISDEQRAAVGELERLGARVAVVAGDVTREEDVQRAIAAAQEMGGLRGVVHAAGILDDAMLAEQSLERFERVMWPKVLGAWNLHQQTAPLGLDALVLFSSQAGLMGSRGQGSYAAANAFLDSLAQYRRQQGLPAMSIDWGPWGEVGMSAAMGERGERQFASMGIGMIPPERGLELMETLLGSGLPQAGVMVVDWKKLAESLPGGSARPLLAKLGQGTGTPGRGERTDLVRELESARPAERTEKLRARVKEIAAKAIGLEATKGIDPQQPLMDLGMDSLMAVELRNGLCRALGRTLPATLAFDYPTIDAIVGYLEREVLRLDKGEPRRSVERTVVRFDASEPIAIIGMACRFPGGGYDPDSFWHLLRDGVDGIIEVPRDRWSLDAFYDPDPQKPGKMYTRFGGFLRESVDLFDPAMFGISSLEAQGMDPQQRFLLEVSWQALEDSGHAVEQLKGTAAGVFVGITSSDYQALQAQLSNLDGINAYTNAACSFSVAAGRLSYVFGLQGPSVAVDTACSSSLVTVHLACQSLRAGECQIALAGGVNLMVAPFATIGFSKSRLMAPDGHCKTFDASADGYVRGEGCGMLVLKRLSDALRDGDHIRAVVRGSAVNQDGASSALTAPNGPAQQMVIRQALAGSGIEPSEVRYIECHGTGTALGDPIEVQSLGAVFGDGRSEANRIAIGSVKTNVGHLESAAGVASLMKVILALQHEEVPPHLNLRATNPYIGLEELPVVISAGRTPWPREAGPRIAGVSGFAFQGTNAHVVVEEAPARPTGERETERSAHVLALSARSEEALRELAGRYRSWLLANPDEELADICFTANTGRNHFGCRAAIVAPTAESLRERLDAYAQGEILAGVEVGLDGARPRRVGFLFGSDLVAYRGMASELYRGEPTFRQAMERSEEIARRRFGLSILETLYSDKKSEEAGPARRLSALAVGHALAELWRTWGITPSAVMGIGVGELAAACVAGVMGPEDATSLVLDPERAGSALAGPLQRPEVAMVSAESGEELVEEACRPEHWRSRGAETGRGLGTAMERLRQMGVELLLELGPGAELLAKARALSPSNEGLWAPSLARGSSDWERMLRSLGALYVRGARVDWTRVDSGAGRRRVALPTYPFQRKSYWLDSARAAVERAPRAASVEASDPGHPLLGRRLESPLAGFEAAWSRTSPAFMQDHGFYGAAIVPATAYLDLVLEGAREVYGPGPKRLEEVVFKEALIHSKDDARTVQLILTPDARGGSSFQIYSRAGNGAGPGEAWVEHAAGRVCGAEPRERSAGDGPGLVEEVQSRCADTSPGHDYYAKAESEAGANFGPRFRGTQTIWRREGEVLIEVKLPELLSEEARAYQIHPAFLDTGFQVLGGGMPLAGWRESKRDPFLPVALDSLELLEQPGDRAWFHVTLGEHTPEALSGDLTLIDEKRRVVLEVKGLHLKRVSREVLERAARGSLREWLHQIEWRAEPREAPEQQAGGARLAAQGHWVLLSDEGGAGEALAALLREQGGTCTMVRAGGAFQSSAPDSFTVRPAVKEDLASVFGAVRERGLWPPRGVLHLWSLDPQSPEENTLEALRADHERSCTSVLHLIQALAAQGAETLLVLVTAAAPAVDAEPPVIALRHAPLWGIPKVVALEHPQLKCLSLALEPVWTPDGIRAVAAELCASQLEDEVVLRGGARYVRRLVSYPLPPETPSSPVTPEASYVITGALGGIGLLVARRLVERGARHLVLIEKRAPSAGALESIKELEAQGARVTVAQLDVTDSAAVERLLSEMGGSMPPLRGIVHAAGVVDDGPMVEQTWARFSRVLGPKVAGAWNLHQLSQQAPLDFFVMFSSQVSLLGNVGQSNYAAANAFLDVLAHHRRARGLPAMTINWGPWQDIGMSAVLGDVAKRNLTSLGISLIPAERGMEAFELALALAPPQLAVGRFDWSALSQYLLHRERVPLLAELLREPASQGAAGGGEPVLVQRLKGARPGARAELLLAELRALVTKIIGLDPRRSIDPGQPLMELGLDSLLTIELTNALGRAVGAALPQTLVFNHPTLDAIVGYVAREVLSLDLVEGPQALEAAAEKAEKAPGDTEELDQLSEDELDALLESELE